MAINFGAGFNIAKAEAVDTRIYLKTLADMLTIDENVYPEVYLAICEENGKLYLFNKSNISDPTTGKFRVLEGSGSAKIDNWIAGNSYNTDDLVVYNSAIYQCIATNSDTVFDDTKWKVLGSDFKIEDWVTGTDYKEKDLIIYSGKLYQCVTSPQADNTVFDETEWLNLSGETIFTKVDKTTIDLATDLAIGNYILNGEIEGVAFANEVSSVLVDGDVYTIVTLSGKVYAFDIVKNTKVEDKFATETKVDDKIHDSLYVEEHYKFNADGTGAFTIVADGTATLPTEIELSAVQAKILADDPHTPYVVGETVDLVSEKEKYLKETDFVLEDELLDLDTFDLP